MIKALVSALCLASFGCAGSTEEGTPADPCACPRGTICVDEQCVSEPPDAEPADARVIATPDARPASDAELADAEIADAEVFDAGLDMAMDQDLPDAELPDLDLPDADTRCEPGSVQDCGRNMGRCRAGRQICDNDGMWGPCEGEIAPEPESCNGADDDCNGVIDDGFDVGEPCEGLGTCGPGVIECRGGFLTVCSTEPGGSAPEAGAERCTGVDEDCDGLTDEGFALNIPCVGACGQGVTVCGPGGGMQCSTEPGGPDGEVQPEVCDGEDNDCDGTADEFLGVGAQCDGVGACGLGVLECDGAGNTRCTTDAEGSESEAAEEQCNGLDDDCDGTTDEGFGVGEACEGAGQCGAGVTECTEAGALRCSTDPGGSASEAGVERCNGADDDCDGSADEGLDLGAACNRPGLCGAGVLECGPAEDVICSSGPGGSADRSEIEQCSSIDEDCDGNTDEGFGIGTPCDGVGACGPGLRECNGAGGSRCSTDAGGSNDEGTVEICDGLDNDCDAQLDEGGACGGETCLNAPTVALSTAVSGDSTALANDYAQSTCLGGSPGPDQIFRFEIDAPGSYVVGVAPLSDAFDAQFWVAEQCEALEQCLAGRDTGAAGRPEARIVNVPRAGGWYTVVDSLGDTGGPFAVGVTPFISGESCAQAIPLSIPGRFVGTTERPRTNDVSGSACPPGRLTVGVDQVFRLTVAEAGLLQAVVTPGQPLDPRRSIKPVVYLVTDCADVDGTCVGGAGAQPAGSAERLEVQVQPGDYYLVVDHEGDLGGAFLLDVSME